MLHRLQVVLSVVVIALCTGYLLVGSSGSERIPGVKSELSECHFLLKYSYVEPVDGKSLIVAGAKALKPLVPDIEFRVNDMSRLDEEQAMDALEQIVEGLKTDHEKGVYLALEGMAASLEDPFTRVMDPESYARFQESLHSRPFGGVGLQLGKEGGAIVVFAVLPGTPAMDVGIRVGDRVLSVDGKSVEQMSAAQAEELLKGEPDTTVVCRFWRNDAAFTKTLRRVTLRTRSVRSRIVKTEDGTPIGWLTVSSMTDTTGDELKEELGKLHKSDPGGLVLDLRDNLGGFVTAAIEVCSTFIDPGLPVVTVDTREESEVKKSEGQGRETLPMIILVNRHTMSSAEIVTACLQDHGRGLVVGEKTFGKGSVQNLHEFQSGGGLKFTIARYLSPEGRAIDGKGLAPDVSMEDTEILPYCQTRWSKAAR